MASDYCIRRACARDLEAIQALHARSLRALGAAHYPAPLIELCLARVPTIEAALIDEGRYLVATGPAGRIVGSGGWSTLRPGYAAPDEPDDPAAATIRGVFVDPDFARRGIASSLIACAEAAALAHGIERLRLKATLSGVPLYLRLGFRPTGRGAIDLGGGAGFAYVAMEKGLGAAACDRAA